MCLSPLLQLLIRWLILRVEHPFNHRLLDGSSMFAHQSCRRHKQRGKYDGRSKRCCCDVRQIRDAQQLFKNERG